MNLIDYIYTYNYSHSFIHLFIQYYKKNFEKPVINYIKEKLNKIQTEKKNYVTFSHFYLKFKNKNQNYLINLY